MKVNLSPEPQILEIPKKNFLHIEKLGPFMKKAPEAWQQFWAICGPVMKSLAVDQMTGLSRIDESKSDDSKFVYQAGVFLKSKPASIPEGLKLREFAGGKYAKFLLQGSYHQLANAYPQAFEILARQKLSLRDEFCAEVYLNTPQDTAEADLKTEILIPIQ